MSSDESTRLSLVRDLIEFPASLMDVVQRLSTLGWDYEGQGVDLTKAHLAHPLRRYLAGELSKEEVASWANHVEGRDDVQAEGESEELISRILHELAKFLITRSLDPIRAKQVLSELNAK